VLKAGVVAWLATDFGAPEAAFAAGPCDKGGPAVVRASPQAVVVRWRVHRHRTHYYACLRSTGRAVFLEAGGDEDPDAVEQTYVDESKFRLAGRFAAVVSTTCSEGCPPDATDVYDLRSRRYVRTVQLGEDFTTAAEVLLSTRGAVVLAWDDGERRLIRVRDSRGSTVVTQGSRRDMPVASMRVHGNLLRWRQAGVEHSFRLR
jgi:hypothetical protein